MSELLPYTVVRAFPGFDVRRYPDCVLVQVHVDTGFTRAASVGLRSLHRYVTGTARAAAPLGVSVPVLQEPTAAAGQLVSLVLPVGTDPAVLPRPSDEAVRIRTVPAHEAAALSVGGGWSAQRFLERGRELLAEVRAFRLEPLGGVYFARFGAGRPGASWTLGVFGRNEALVRVTSA